MSRARIGQHLSEPSLKRPGSDECAAADDQWDPSPQPPISAEKKSLKRVDRVLPYFPMLSWRITPIGSRPHPDRWRNATDSSGDCLAASFLTTSYVRFSPVAVEHAVDLALIQPKACKTLGNCRFQLNSYRSTHASYTTIKKSKVMQIFATYVRCMHNESDRKAESAVSFGQPVTDTTAGD